MSNMFQSVNTSGIETKTFKYSHYRLLNYLVFNYLSLNPRNTSPAILNKNNGPYRIDLSELKQYLGLKENKQIVDHFQKLSKSYMAFTDASGNNLGFSSIVASEVLIEDGSLYFNFPEYMKKLIESRKIGDEITFNGTVMFKNKFAKDLYYIAKETTENETEWIDVSDFRELLAVPDKKIYNNFKNVGSKIISPSISEINLMSDLKLEVEYITDDKGIKSVRFKIEKSEPVVISPVVSWEKIDAESKESSKNDASETDNSDPLYKAKMHVNDLSDETLKSYQDDFVEMIKSKKMVFQRFQKYGFKDVLIENVFLQYVRDNVLTKAS